MAVPRFHLPLLLAFLLLSTTAAVSHPQHHGHGPHPHHHHHRSPSTMTATARLDTAPSMHQNRMESESESEETRQSLRVLNPFFTTVAAAQAPSGHDAIAAIGAAADAGDTTARFDLPSPPPSLPAAGDPVSSSLASPQPHAEEAGSSASEPAAPPPIVNEPFRDAASTTPPPPPVVDEPLRDAASTPPPPPVVGEPVRDAASPPPAPPVVDEPYRDAAIPPPPFHDDAAWVVSLGTGDDLGLQQIAKVLASLGYNEMASSATLLADSMPAATWPGAITVFGAPDVFLQHSCPECSRRHLLDHMALGYFPYAELAAAPARKLPSASVGLCLDVAAQTQRGPFSVHHASLYVNGVVVSEPELYDDGRYVVHGLHGFIPPLSNASCIEDVDAHHPFRRRHHLRARSAATSAASAASVVRIMIREAIPRLRDSGFGFVALAMRVKFPELEKLSNLTVFALDDQAIYSGGGHGYVSDVSLYIVPGHRLTRADLLRLHPGTVLPTLAGEDQKLVITLGVGSATDEIQINHIPVKEPDVVINSRVAVHGICAPLPRDRLLSSRAGQCDSSVLATHLVQFCTAAIHHPSGVCCNAVLMAVDNDQDCLCSIAEEGEFAISSLVVATIWELYKVCGGHHEVTPIDKNMCEHGSNSPPPPPATSAPTRIGWTARSWIAMVVLIAGVLIGITLSVVKIVWYYRRKVARAQEQNEELPLHVEMAGQSEVVQPQVPQVQGPPPVIRRNRFPIPRFCPNSIMVR